jgi:hypothetical protein
MTATSKFLPRNRHPFRTVFLLAGFLLTGFPAAYAEPTLEVSQDGGRLMLQEENDYFASNDDRHYTQGARVSYLTGQVISGDGWDQPFTSLSQNMPIFDGAHARRRYEWSGGQSIFTPTNLETTTNTPRDRPYAAWLYVGASMLQDSTYETHHTLENLELLAGVVGPAALGGVTQNTFHQFISVDTALGWKNELHNEPGAILTYERKWRFQQPLFGDFVVDAIPEFGVSAGNILTYGQTGLMVRLGQNLGADYGPNRIRPSLSGTGWFDPAQLNGDLGWYVFAGAQGRAVAHNIFLDGNDFTSSAGVDKKPLVADFTGGVSVFWSSAVRADFYVTQRTKEFYGQRSHPDRFGGINLTIGF